MMEGTVMKNTEAIEKAKEHFGKIVEEQLQRVEPVSYTHLRAHET